MENTNLWKMLNFGKCLSLVNAYQSISSLENALISVVNGIQSKCLPLVNAPLKNVSLWIWLSMENVNPWKMQIFGKC